MPEYFATIKLDGRDREEIVRMLQKAFGAMRAEQARIVRRGEPDYDNDCRRSGHFGCVHWTDDDIESKITELRLSVTPELLREVKNRIGHIDDGMTELGWEAIESAILEVVETPGRSE